MRFDRPVGVGPELFSGCLVMTPGGPPTGPFAQMASNLLAARPSGAGGPPLLGIVENMSYFIAPDTGKRYDIFGHGGARREAERLGVFFLGEVPLQMEIRETSDAGTPVVVSRPDGPEAKIYRDIAAKVWERVTEEKGAAQAATPSIVFE